MASGAVRTVSPKRRGLFSMAPLGGAVPAACSTRCST